MSHGSQGERTLQIEMNSVERAQRFYERQMCDSFTEKMIALIQRQEMMFIATSDATGNCDCSPRFGKTGFVVVLDDKTIAYPEYRGNGVYASMGNILENEHIGIVFVDFFNTTVGLHVNGSAKSYPLNKIPSMLSEYIDTHAIELDSIIERWVIVHIEEAYIHCSKHAPLLQKKSKHIEWGTDDPVEKSSDYFDHLKTNS